MLVDSVRAMRMRPVPAARIRAGLIVVSGQERLYAGGIEVLHRPVVRPGPAIGLRRMLRKADGRQIFVAAGPRPDAGGREIMAVVPRRTPIGANDAAWLIIVEPHHLAAMSRFGIAEKKLWIDRGEIGRARGTAGARIP